MLTQGWIKLYRSIQESSVFDDGEPYTRRDAWIWILLNANVKESEFYHGFELVRVRRGQLCISVRKLATSWNRSLAWCANTLKLFTANGMLEKSRTPGGTILTVVNYDFYQSSECDPRTLGDTDREHSVEQSANAPWNNSKKDKKDKKDKESKKESPIVPFEQFWEAYPKKVGKESALKAFKKIAPDEDLMQTILGAIVKQKLSRQWQENGGQYIPYPATWLNGHRWEDEMEPASRSGLAAASTKPSRNDYDQRENMEPDMDSVPMWLQEYAQYYKKEGAT